MTRYARSGNTQKHEKMPGESTPWKELSQKTASAKQSGDVKKAKGRLFNKNNRKKRMVQNNLESSDDVNISNVRKSDESMTTKTSHSTSITMDLLEEKSQPQQSEKNEEMIVKCDAPANEENQNVSTKVLSEMSDLDKQNQKARKREQHEIARAKKGIILLTPQVEKKLYRIRKALHKKGLPEDEIKQILRKERRTAELSFRKTMNKTCFNCRQTGHVLADCPSGPGTSGSEFKKEIQQNICFKCGSAEHSSSRCSKKVMGFPFATCFVCKETGHISKDCPKNRHGIYIKGGKCGLCGNVNHLMRDCTSKKKNINEETEVLGHMIDEGTSVDAEIVEKKKIPRKTQNTKKLKIVKF